MNTIKQLILMFQIYSLDITIDGMSKSIAQVDDYPTRLKIAAAREVARSERLRLKHALYTLRYGKSQHWLTA